MTMEEVCPINLYIQTISSVGKAGSKYVRLIGVNGGQCKCQEHSHREGSMSG